MPSASVGDLRRYVWVYCYWLWVPRRRAGRPLVSFHRRGQPRRRGHHLVMDTKDPDSYTGGYLIALFCGHRGAFLACLRNACRASAPRDSLDCIVASQSESTTQIFHERMGESARVRPAWIRTPGLRTARPGVSWCAMDVFRLGSRMPRAVAHGLAQRASRAWL